MPIPFCCMCTYYRQYMQKGILLCMVLRGLLKLLFQNVQEKGYGCCWLHYIICTCFYWYICNNKEKHNDASIILISSKSYPWSLSTFARNMRGNQAIHFLSSLISWCRYFRYNGSKGITSFVDFHFFTCSMEHIHQLAHTEVF